LAISNQKPERRGAVDCGEYRQAAGAGAEAIGVSATDSYAVPDGKIASGNSTHVVATIRIGRNA
jgi:hypothetical protein